MGILKVLVGISGGVDSAVAALNLKNQGYHVECCTMIMFDDLEYNEVLIRNSKEVADKLGLKHHVLDATKIFQETVISDFVLQYSLGRTPNPCVVCNKNIKFGLFLDYAKTLNFDYISTGHYAKVFYDAENAEYLLKKAVSAEKDQSYFLYNLNQKILSRVLFPLAEFEKTQIKQVAFENGLIPKTQKESQDICFIKDGDYVAFLEKNNINNILGLASGRLVSGNFVDEIGNVLGQHNGIYKYTIGQRKKLGISLNKKMFVTDINFAENTVVLSEKDPIASELLAKDVNIISPRIFEENIKNNIMFDVKIRYKHRAKPARIKIKTDNKNNQESATQELKIIFQEPQRAVTKGQSVVFYHGDIVVGGGIIK